jgi:DNA-directed RNA polymerase specialized sigma24 family protein
MARDDHMHQRLLEWAQAVTVGDGSGYPTMSVLHEDWTPPSPGLTPILKSSPHSAARQTHRLVGLFSARLQDTVTLHYCFPGLSIAEQAARLDCGVRTVHERIEVAHRLLRAFVDSERRLSARDVPVSQPGF